MLGGMRERERERESNEQEYPFGGRRLEQQFVVVDVSGGRSSAV